ncbi:MAG: hypothetical protein VYD71_04050 [Bacteroidota bacterium]|nr:hypothetical protein [Bacteroidota bacterium]
MTTFNSLEVAVNLSPEALYGKLSNLNNLQTILPPQVSEFESTTESCSFKMGGMPKISLQIDEKVPNSKISLIAKDSQVPFNLVCEINEDGENCKAVLQLNAELNMMMKMMLEKPLTNFLNKTAEGLSKL